MLSSVSRSFVSSLFALSLAVGLVACGDSDECSTNTDCPSGRICRLGLCALDPGGGDGTVDTTPDVPLDCLVAGPDDLIMTEIMADPPSGADIDGNGTASSTGDEFVEVVNIAARPVALTNVQLDVGGKRVGLGTLCINPYQARVLFGSADLPGLTNSSGTVSLVVDGTVVQTHTYGAEGGRDSSLTLSAQLDKTSAWVLHKDVAPTAYSAGTCSNGNAFPDCDGVVNPPDTEVTGDSEVIVPTCSTAPVAGDLVINELLADPTGLDANGDLLPGTNDDEFIELVNTSANTLLLDGLVYRDAGTKVFNFPAGLCLAPNQAVLIFGAYAGTGDFGDTIVLNGANISLNNDADTVSILDATSTVLAQATYSGTVANADQSIVRETDLSASAAFVRHSLAPNAGGTRMSPGRCQNGNTFPDCTTVVEPPPGDVSDAETTETTETIDPGDTIAETVGDTETVDDVGPTCGPAPVIGDLVINEILMDPPSTFDANEDGTANTSQDEFVEIVNVSPAAVSLQGVRVGDFDNVNNVPTLRYRITFGALCLQPGEAVVVFGRGAWLYTAAGRVLINATASYMSLNNDSETIVISDALDNELARVQVGLANDQSWTRSPDLTGAFVQHKSVVTDVPASPGKCISLQTFPGCFSP